MSMPQAPFIQNRYSWAEIILGTIAVMALAGILLVGLLMVTSIVAVLAVGIDGMEPVFDSMKDRTGLRSNPLAQTIAHFVGLLVYAAVGLAVVGMAAMQRRMSASPAQKASANAMLAERVGFYDWTLDRQYWLLLAGVLVYAIIAGSLLEQVYPEAREWTIMPKTPLPLFLAFVVIVGAAPFCEELLFRGWIFTPMRTRLAFMPTLLITSALFALAHFERTLLYALVVFPVGLVLGYVRERYGSIKASATFHGMYNLFAFIIALLGIG